MTLNLKDHKKPLLEDKEFVSDVHDEDMSGQKITRVFAVKKTFTAVSFKQADISHTYFRNCRFIQCDFSGASISRSNFRGSRYEECQFRYATWQHTIVDDNFLDSCLPSEENLARDLVRSLRVNFGEIGNYAAVNKAASIEVALTGQHLYNAAYSNQSYYRAKYKGWSRVLQAARHVKWKVLEYLWGNGESLTRIVFSGVFVIVVGAAILPWWSVDLLWPDTLGIVATAFWGIGTSPLQDSYLALLTAARFILLGLFMAILIKRLSRR